MTAAEAAGALEDLDTLSDADVERLLGRILPAVPPHDEPELVDAASTLGRLDDLADDQVDALLARLMEQRDG